MLPRLGFLTKEACKLLREGGTKLQPPTPRLQIPGFKWGDAGFRISAESASVIPRIAATKWFRPDIAKHMRTRPR